MTPSALTLGVALAVVAADLVELADAPQRFSRNRRFIRHKDVVELTPRVRPTSRL